MAKGKPKVAAFASDEKVELGEGVLALVDNQIDQTTGTVRLKATFANTDHALWPGQFINVRLYLEVRRGVTVPAPAVQRSAQGSFVYVIRADSTVEARPVVVAQNRDGVALLDRGLAAGEQIVTDGQYKLRPGIRVAASAAKPAPPSKS
jgi:multidrug efflux system membrane fusion protein